MVILQGFSLCVLLQIGTRHGAIVEVGSFFLEVPKIKGRPRELESIGIWEIGKSLENNPIKFFTNSKALPQPVHAGSDPN